MWRGGEGLGEGGGRGESVYVGGGRGVYGEGGGMQCECLKGRGGNLLLFVTLLNGSFNVMHFQFSICCIAERGWIN